MWNYSVQLLKVAMMRDKVVFMLFKKEVVVNLERCIRGTGFEPHKLKWNFD